MFKPLPLIALTWAGLSLQACWVPQVIQGVRPDIFPSAAPEVSPSANRSLESKQIALATEMIHVARSSGQLLVLSAELASHRQNLENHLYYTVKNAGDLSQWYFDNNQYTHYDTRNGARYTLALRDRNGQPYPAEGQGFDLLGFGSYGPEPLPARRFPESVNRYQLSLQQSGIPFSSQLNLLLQGEWPSQIPLRGGFQTRLSGQGQQINHPDFQDLTLQFNGLSQSDQSQLSGQLAFSASIEGKVYNGFGQINAGGFLNTVQLEQNGVTFLQIVRESDRWDVLREGQVVASTR